MRKCRVCGVEKALEEFYKAGRKGSNSEVRHTECKECSKARVKRTQCPIRQRSNNLRRNYGITLEDYDNMLEEQGGTCMTCSSTPESQRYGNLYVDHDHNTGQVRGLLCHHCNTALGLVDDNIDILLNLVKYLSR